MPRIPLHALTWSMDQGCYELHTQGQLVQCFRTADQQAWQNWLCTVNSLAFHSPFGSLNVYQETRPHGGQYWYAYHTGRGGTRKRYLGRTARVSIARLEETAQALSNENESKLSPVPTSSSSLHPSPEADRALMLLLTKLSPPRLPNSLVARDRLLAALGGAFSTPLTLLSAPAGWGKTTLISSWASGLPRQVAWLSLDEIDNELTRFWISIIEALRRCRPGIGALALAMLHSPQSPPYTAVITALLNELADLGEQTAPILLLLDDYHVISDAAIRESLLFWLEHLPASVHLLISSRVDPDLPLSRLRARGQMLEIRADDLRFRPDEAGTFLHYTMGLSLSEEEIATLERRTEGWVAGLQLAALSLRKQEDRSGWITSFTGSHRYLLDYVHDEILSRQPQPVQRFLLQVAILTRMNAGVCQAVTGEQGSREMLETLERSNLFVVPLDEQRHWYRLHDLFREALLVHLQANEPELLLLLHQRAAHWYESDGEGREAITHALAARDFSYAARLLERGAPNLWLSGEAHTLHMRVQELPDAVLLQYADLALETALRLLHSLHETVSASYAGTLSQVKQTLARLEAALQRQEGLSAGQEVEGALPALSETDVPVIKRRLRLLHALMTARSLIRSGDAHALHLLAQEMMELSEEEVVRWKMISFTVTFWLTEALRWEGALLIPWLLDIKVQLAQTSEALDMVRVMEWLVFAYMRAGRTRSAHQECLEALALVKQTDLYAGFEGYLHYHLARIYYAWNRLEEAANSLQQVLSIARDWQQTDLQILGDLVLAQLELAGGDLAAADQALQLAEALHEREEVAPHTFRVATARVRYWLAAGDLEAAGYWAEQMVFSPEAWDPTHKTALLIQVRVFLARQQYLLALDTLERWSGQLDQPGDIENTIQFLALQVVALHQARKSEQAQDVATRLLKMTEPEGSIRVYLDQDEPMKQALIELLAAMGEQLEQAHQAPSPSRSYVSRLLAAFEQEEKRQSGPSPTSTTSHSHAHAQKPSAVSSALVIPLTYREQEVLRLLAGGASNQEISNALVISLATVKKHVSNLLSKLGAESRTQAIAKARAISLL